MAHKQDFAVDLLIRLPVLTAPVTSGFGEYVQ
jgi:hypothetical protein